jgi:hypothetical protein
MNWKFWQKRKTQPKKKKGPLREWRDAVIFAIVAATLIRALLFKPMLSQAAQWKVRFWLVIFCL